MWNKKDKYLVTVGFREVITVQDAELFLGRRYSPCIRFAIFDINLKDNIA